MQPYVFPASGFAQICGRDAEVWNKQRCNRRRLLKSLVDDAGLSDRLWREVYHRPRQATPRKAHFPYVRALRTGRYWPEQDVFAVLAV